MGNPPLLKFIRLYSDVFVGFTESAPEEFKKKFMEKFGGQRITEAVLAQIKVFEETWRAARNS